jgi:hypothetical protein
MELLCELVSQSSIAQTYEIGQYVIRHLDETAVAIEENGAQETNLLHCENPFLTKIDPIANIERVPHK